MGRRFTWDEETKSLVELTPSRNYCDAPHVITDEMDAVSHPASGRMITSKKKFDEETIASGCIPAGGCDRRTRTTRSVDYESRNAFDEAVRGQIDRMEKVECELRDGRRPFPTPKREETIRLWEKVSRGG